MGKTSQVLVVLVTLMVASHGLMAQEQKDPYDLVREAIELMDGGDYERSRKVLREAMKTAPDDSFVLYEYGYSYRLENELDSAVKYFRLACEQPDAPDQTYCMYASALDDNDQIEEAGKVYDDALKKYPNSYMLYHERGVFKGRRGHQEQALMDLQHAIEIKPDYAPSYLRCAQLQLSEGKNTFWAMYEGEIFMNLEPDSERSREFANDLVQNYVKNLNLSKKGPSTTFCSDVAVKDNDGDGDAEMTIHRQTSHIIPYGLTGYEMPLAIAAIGHEELTLSSLIEIRSDFVSVYDSLKVDDEYGQNVLVNYWRRIRLAGHEIAYNMWLFERAAPEVFNNYRSKNAKEYEDFLDWQREHPLTIDHTNAFLRKNYD